MATLGPHTTTVTVDMGECPACKTSVTAHVTASVSLMAVGTRPTSANGQTVVTLHTDKVSVEHARIEHNCGPKVAIHKAASK